MKDLLLINSGLPVNFSAKVMDTTNYLCNQLPIRRCRSVFILKEAWTSMSQNLEHLQIFESSVSTFIPNEKYTKLDVQKTWKGIFIG